MPESFCVLTFNIRREGEEFDVGDLWEARRQAVVDLIKRSGASIVGLQETKPGQVAYLVDALSPDYVCVGEGREDDRAGESSPIFVRSCDFEVLRSQTCWISPTPDEPGSKHTGAHCPRVLTCAELRRRDGCGLYAFNTHLDHAGLKDATPDFHVQGEQAALVCGLADRFCGASALPRVIVGDLNSGCDLGAPPVFVQAGYIDASRGDESFTFCGFDGLGSEITALYGATRKTIRKIDWIFARGLTIGAYNVFAEQYDASDGKMRYHSDHLAVAAEMCFEPQAAEISDKTSKDAEK